VGRGPPDLPAQGADRSARPHAHLAPVGGHQRLPAARRKRVRHLRHRPQFHQHQRGAGYGAGGQAQGRRPPHGGRHRRRRDDRRHGLRGAQQRRCQPRWRQRRPAGGAQRQRHVDQPAGGCAQPASGPVDERQVLRRRTRRRQGGAEERAAAVRTGATFRRARQGHGRARHHLRGVRFQLRRSHRRPRSRFPDPHAGKPAHQARRAVPARGHQEGLRLQAGRGRPGEVPRCERQVRPGRGFSQERGQQTELHPGLRPVAVRHGRSRRPPGRHHAGHARRLGHGRVPQALSASATTTWASPSSTR
jgi:hypothetical protein